MEILCFYPDFKQKAFTLSYDDGVMQDRRLVEMFNAAGVKATFNLNSQRQSRLNGWTHESGLEIRYLDKTETVALYAGHEIAVHGANHPHMETLTVPEIVKEIRSDKCAHEAQFGSIVTGMAYPFGTYDQRVIKAAKAEGLSYARTTKETLDFSTPEEFMEWDATCHHNYKNLLALAQEFTTTDQELALFYVWGHSYEFDVDDNWQQMEYLLALTAKREDTWYATNGQIARYLAAMQELTVREGVLVNPTNVPLWVEVDGEKRVISCQE